MRRSVWLLMGSLAAAAPCAAEVANWHLYPAGCQGGVAALEIPCGSIGRYLVNEDPASPPPCTEIRHGGSDGGLYPPERMGVIFHVRAPRLGEELAAVSSTKQTKQKDPGLKAIIVPGGSLDWIPAIDFDDWHGDSITWLVDQVAGPDVTAKLVPLDRPAWAVLGDDVGDFHVLAAICAVAEEVLHNNVPVPRAVNMSFGRHRQSEDPDSAADCPSPPVLQTTACEIARAVAQLTQQGTRFVSAAGNHGTPLFPGSLDEVISAGMLDLTRFFDGGTRAPAWETPPDADALIPGNGLCLGSWAAPSGSSYSSAVLAGWIARLVKTGSPLLTQAGTWVPVYNSSPSKQCWTLGKGSTASAFCNAPITSMFSELSGRSAPCWNAATEPRVTVQGLPPSTPPEIDPQDTHVFFAAHPTPESDPCVPCSGYVQINGPSSDLRLDLSQSQPLPEEVHLDQVTLRIDDQYIPLDLIPSDIVKMEQGELAELVVSGVGPLVAPDVSVSLWYRMYEGNTACENRESCFWSSTPVLLDK